MLYKVECGFWGNNCWDTGGIGCGDCILSVFSRLICVMVVGVVSVQVDGCCSNSSLNNKINTV